MNPEGEMLYDSIAQSSGHFYFVHLVLLNVFPFVSSAIDQAESWGGIMMMKVPLTFTSNAFSTYYRVQ